MQRVKADWSTALDPRAQALRAEGYLVVVGDHLRFREKLCIFDTLLVPNSLIYPL